VRTALASLTEACSHPPAFFEGFRVMTPGVNVIFIPVPMPMPTVNGVGWEKRAKPAPYPREDRGRWPLQTPVPARDQREARALIEAAKKWIAEDRARRHAQA
jgi:hypothetical protein